MAYTVQRLAKLSGVSVRTLHWYHKNSLLEPAYCLENGYRYYEEEQLLRLQQILFFKDLGFKLRQIQGLLSQENFDWIKALSAQKMVLEEEIVRKRQLIDTLSKTIDHLKGKQVMTHADLYEGFDPQKQKDYESYLVKYYGTKVEDLLMESQKCTVKWGPEEWDSVKA
jgi:DNA-binding transcriptional MerR regulator